MFSYVAASLDGLPTIRSANAEDMVKREFDSIQDQHTSTWYLFIAVFEAFGFYLDMVSIIFLVLATVQFLLNEEGKLSRIIMYMNISQSYFYNRFLDHISVISIVCHIPNYLLRMS